MISHAVKELYNDIHAALLVRYSTMTEMVSGIIAGDVQNFVTEQIDIAVFSGRVTDSEITEAVNDPEWATNWRGKWLDRL